MFLENSENTMIYNNTKHHAFWKWQIYVCLSLGCDIWQQYANSIPKNQILKVMLQFWTCLKKLLNNFSFKICIELSHVTQTLLSLIFIHYRAPELYAFCHCVHKRRTNFSSPFTNVSMSLQVKIYIIYCYFVSLKVTVQWDTVLH